MSTKTATAIKNLRSSIVQNIKDHPELGVWTNGHVYKTDMHLINITNYPCVTVQVAKKTPKDGAQGYVNNRVRFKIRAYSQILGDAEAIDRIADEQVDLGETISDMLIDNYSIDNTCDNSNLIDVDYMYLKNKEDESIFLQCVEVTLDAYKLITRFD